VLVVFGDETSFGLAAALRQSSDTDRQIHYVFEVSSSAESELALARLDLQSATLIERRPVMAHLAEVEEAVLRLVEHTSNFVLTGNATSIQRIQRSLKQRGVSSWRLYSKVYWAAGRTGLD
jgi:ferric-chelate reductase (NADPH)